MIFYFLELQGLWIFVHWLELVSIQKFVEINENGKIDQKQGIWNKIWKEKKDIIIKKDKKTGINLTKRKLKVKNKEIN